MDAQKLDDVRMAEAAESEALFSEAAVDVSSPAGGDGHEELIVDLLACTAESVDFQLHYNSVGAPS